MKWWVFDALFHKNLTSKSPLTFSSIHIIASLWNKKGALLVTLTALLVSLSNSLVHSLTASIPTSQLLFLKAGIGFMLCFPWLSRHWIAICKTPNKHWHLQKIIIGAIGNACWLKSLQELPLADATTLSLASALLTALGAALFFGERLRLMTLIALILGGIGVVLTLTPSLSIFSWLAMLPLISAACYSASSLFVKKISIVDTTYVTLFYLLGGMTLLSAPFAFISWVPLPLIDLIKIIIIGGLYCLIQWALIYAYAHANAGYLAPFKFIRFPLAMLIGSFWFGEMVSFHVIIGGILILGACLLIQYTRHDPSHLLRNKSYQEDKTS
jgi:drug/metabolite transporter (DMT)-like permease